MELSALTIILLSFGSSVIAQEPEEGPFPGWFSPAPDDEFGPLPVPSDLIVHHNQNPNISRSGTFKPFQDTWEWLRSDSVLRDAEWTWRVNVSQFYAPYNGTNISEVAKRGDYQAFVSQTWDLSWPIEGNLSEALDDARSTLCITQLGAGIDLPVNVTNSLKDDDTSCVPALGQACVDAILKQISPPDEKGSCHTANQHLFSLIPECYGSFGRDRGPFNSTTTIGYSLGNKSQQINSGETFWVNVSGPVLGNEIVQYQTAANQMQVLHLSALLPTTHNSSDTFMLHGKELRCLRANTTKLQDVDVNGDGVATVGEVVLLSAGTTTTVGIGSVMHLGLWALAVAVILG
ncbi:hypothetical protein F4808DRAFT_437462 [Astrocystis sublimbata]|nr:hypothetical protein F4808DRAFT_437462 [Astrocystis sublimbata]